MNTLDAHPKAAAAVAFWRQDGQFVPHLSNGKLCGTDSDIMASVALPNLFTAKDFIVGMELLGFRFSIGDLNGKEALCTADPDELPESWHRHSMRLLALCRGREQVDGCIAFLRDRKANR